MHPLKLFSSNKYNVGQNLNSIVWQNHVGDIFSFQNNSPQVRNNREFGLLHVKQWACALEFPS